MKSLPPLHTRLGELKADHEDEIQALEEAATRWLEGKAAGQDTTSIEQELKEHERASRRLEKKLHKAKRGNK